MPAITSTDLNNAKLDVDHIAAIATSTDITATDRLGHVKDTISGAVYKITQFTDRGAWTTATAYSVKDLVSNSGTWYVAIVAHTSGATFVGDVTTKWRVYQGVTSGDLAASTGASAVGSADGTTIAAQLKNSLHHTVNSFAALRALDKTKYTRATVIGGYTSGDGIGGDYCYDSADTTTLETVPNTIVATDGGRWKITASNTNARRQGGFRALQQIGVPRSTADTVKVPVSGATDGGYPEFGACFDNNGHMWVPLHGTYTVVNEAVAAPSGVMKIDPVSGTILAIWRPATKTAGIYSVSCCPTTGEIWVADRGAKYTDSGERVGRVYVIDANTLITLNTRNCDVGEHPAHVLFDPITATMMVLNGEAGLLQTGPKINTVSKYNATTYAHIATTASLGLGLSQGVHCPDDGYIWCTLYVDGTVIRVNPTTMTAVSAALSVNFGATVGANPIGITFDPKTRSIWTGNNVTQNVSRINPIAYKVTQMVGPTTHFDPYGLIYAPEVGLLVCSNFSGSTDFIDPVTCRVVSSINQNAAGWRSNGTIYDPSSNTLWNLGNTSPSPYGPSSLQRLAAPLQSEARVIGSAVNAGGVAQTIPSAVLTLLVFNSKDFDPTNSFSTATNRFTPGVRGIFRIAANSFFGSLAATSTTVFMSIFKNGSQYRDGPVVHPAVAGGSIGVSVDALVHANLDTDYFEFYIHQDGGAPVNTNGLARLTYASIAQVSVGQVGDST